MNKKTKILIYSAIIVLIVVIIFVLTCKKLAQNGHINLPQVTNFQECADTGSAIMESYPRQCRYNNQTFTEDIGNVLEKENLITLESPRPNDQIASPLTIKGKAIGPWYFEASFPVKLLDGNDNTIATGIAQAQGEWMTEDFVPFTANLTFTIPATKYGKLILEKDNPSDLPENADQLIIPVKF